MSKKYSDLKIVWHHKKLRSFLEDKITSPIEVRIKPTNRCNHKCFYCIYDTGLMHPDFSKTDQIPKGKLLEILDDLKDMGVKSIIYSGGGDPLMYPHIKESLERTIENDIRFAMLTNGQKLDLEVAELLGKADWVRVSLDYHNQKLFSEIRNVSEQKFKTIESNIERFAKIKQSSCNLGINCVVHNKNKDYLYDITKFCKNLGVESIRFAPLWVPDFFEYHKNTKEDAIRQIEKVRKELVDNKFEAYESYTSEFESGGNPKRDYKKCYIMQTIPAIGADSNVYFCHNKAYDKSGLLGSIKDKSFNDLWFSPKSAERFRNSDVSSLCNHQCSNDLRNKIILDLLDCYDGSDFM